MKDKLVGPALAVDGQQSANGQLVVDVADRDGVIAGVRVDRRRRVADRIDVDSVASVARVQNHRPDVTIDEGLVPARQEVADDL
jgi:hypothetical protein